MGINEGSILVAVNRLRLEWDSNLIKSFKYYDLILWNMRNTNVGIWLIYMLFVQGIE